MDGGGEEERGEGLVGGEDGVGGREGGGGGRWERQWGRELFRVEQQPSSMNHER